MRVIDRFVLHSALGAGVLLQTLVLSPLPLYAQVPELRPDSTPAAPAPAAIAPGTPLPDIAALMRSVEAQQRAAEARQQDYIYHSRQTLTELDRSGKPKKAELREYNDFWLQGVPVRKMVAKDGKELDAGELRKEDDRIDREVRQAKERRMKNDSQGKQTDPRGDEEVTVSRILELGSFSNARRVAIDGRSTIAVDYTGDPGAKTRNRAEAVFRDLTGTLWVDETDHELVKVQGRFARSFKIGGGLLADIHEGTTIGLVQRKINNEAWLPTEIDANGTARFLFFSVHGAVHIANSDFRRFQATSTILPDVNKVEEPKP